MYVFCDFDGTISIRDATDHVLSRLASPEWIAIEQEWKNGVIGSAECMRRQIALIRATRQELDNVLDEVEIDPGFTGFNDFCRRRGIPLTVISDGVDYFIGRILARNRLAHLPVIANRLAIDGLHGHSRYRLTSPYGNADCTFASGVCKCRALQSPGMWIYIGDGRSDFCVSGKADVIFAKDKLAEYCADQGINFIPYQQFSDVTRTLERMLPAILRGELQTADYAVA